MDLKLDANGDLDTTGGKLTLLDGTDAISQSCAIRLKFFQGEWFLDQRLGVPWFQEILGEKTRLNVVRAILQKAILTTPGLLAISSFEMDYTGATRTLSVSFTGQAESGSFDFTSELIV